MAATFYDEAKWLLSHDPLVIVDECISALTTLQALMGEERVQLPSYAIERQSNCFKYHYLCGNGSACTSGQLYVGDMVWMTGCYLRVMSRTELRQGEVTLSYARTVASLVRACLCEWEATGHDMWMQHVDSLFDECARVAVFYATHVMQGSEAELVVGGAASALNFSGSDGSSALLKDEHTETKQKDVSLADLDRMVGCIDPFARRGVAPSAFWNKSITEAVLKNYIRPWNSDVFISESARLCFFVECHRDFYQSALVRHPPKVCASVLFWSLMNIQREFEIADEMDREVVEVAARMQLPLGARHEYLKKRQSVWNDDLPIRSSLVMMRDCGMKYANHILKTEIPIRTQCDAKQMGCPAADASILCVWSRYTKSFFRLDFLKQFVILNDKLFENIRYSEQRYLHSVFHHSEWSPENDTLMAQPLLLSTIDPFTKKRRLPLVVRSGGVWFVQHVSAQLFRHELYQCQTLADALYLWCRLLKDEFDATLYDGSSLAELCSSVL
jgi:hypothetical protein